MYFPNVVGLKQFYSSSLGRVAQYMIAQSIARMWPDASKESMLAIGYPTPYLDRYLDQAESLIVCMPSHQGAIYWPADKTNHVVLAHEAELPLPDATFNRILLVHTLEQSEQLRGLMQEVWRLLTPGGRVLTIVPNRLSFWARSANSPFGYGRPFSLYQIKGLLEDSKLTFTRSSSTLFALPSQARWIIKSAALIEIIGEVLLPMFGGVLLVEAEKQIYAAIQEPVAARRANPQPITAQVTPA